MSSKVPTLLVADDSTAIQRVVELMFADENVRVVAVGDGNLAIQRLETAPPDIVLADIGMPGRDGYEVSRYVKESPQLAHIPVVLLSGAFETVDQVRAAEARCDGVFAKPFEPHLVVNRVQQLLAGPHRAESPAPPTAHPSPSHQSAPQPRAGESPARADQLDQYFDRLGAAFAERLRNPPPAAAPTVAAVESTSEQVAEAPPTELQSKQVAVRDVASANGPLEPPAAEVKTLADRFAELLAAQQTPPRDTGPNPPFQLSDDVVEQVSRRVLAHLTDRVVRETVADIVADIAERMVREEIERIKAAIK